ncbi:MAG TPA: amidase [Terriglobales bacterium]|jgi:aspartyl-tRNA(Asn)/glutamyl-tRNA(Gln) amidotransferase subunit A|nr:amidase [Terriglobales bacterium]
MALRSIAETAEQLRRKEISPVEVVRECLAAIDRLNPTLNAFITVTAESALADAKKAEQEIQSGNWRGPLHGIPVGLKDLIDTAGVRTTAASAVFRDRIPTGDADVIKKLKKAGAVIVGKQNLHEFAYGGSSLISHYGPVRNPVNPEFIAGGSSGGSAAAVASGMCYAAIGTDTAGSIREPAAICGIVGLKPSYGLVSTRGIIPLSQSLDHPGPLTRTVEDAAIVLDAISETPEGYAQEAKAGIGDFVLGIPRKYFFDELDGEIASAVEEAITHLAGFAKAIREVEVPVENDRTVFTAESKAYHRDKIASSADLYDPETLRRLRTGNPVEELEYQNALGQLRRIRQTIGEIFREVNVLITPTIPSLTPRISDLLEDISLLRPAEIILLRNTRPVNVWGLPAISVPCGFDSRGLPIGLQIIGRPGGDREVLRAAYGCEERG